MDQAQLELQLKVWKELAISKQVMMRGAAEALKLDPDCTQEELKAALEAAIKKVSEADANVINAQEQARAAIAAMEKKVVSSAQGQAAAEAVTADLRAAQERTTQQMAVERATIAKDLQGLKDRIAEKEKALKAVNTALADTPENVIKKMKTLKKEKQDEAEARRRVEASLNNLRTEKRQLDQRMTDATSNSAKLVSQYRELHALCVTLHDQLKPLIADAKDLAAVPELDSKLLESIEQINSNPKKEQSSS